MIIIGSETTLIVGSTHKGELRDGEGNPHPDTWIYIMREATEEEWIQFCDENGTAPRTRRWPHYYEIHTD